MYDEVATDRGAISPVECQNNVWNRHFALRSVCNHLILVPCIHVKVLLFYSTMTRSLL